MTICSFYSLTQSTGVSILIFHLLFCSFIIIDSFFMRRFYELVQGDCFFIILGFLYDSPYLFNLTSRLSPWCFFPLCPPHSTALIPVVLAFMLYLDSCNNLLIGFPFHVNFLLNPYCIQTIYHLPTYPSSSLLPLLSVMHSQLSFRGVTGLSLNNLLLVDIQFSIYICPNPIYFSNPRLYTLLPKAICEGLTAWPDHVVSFIGALCVHGLFP